MKRVGLVGCGNIGSVHAKVIADIDDACLCAFADVRPERAEVFAERYGAAGVAVYDSLEAMLDGEDLDVVHICTPHVCHVPMAVTALKKDCHVFLEKPPALSREEFEQLEQAAAAGPGNVGICFQNRYNEATEKVSELLAGGTLGRIRGGRVFVTWNRNAPYYTESDWRGSLKTEGGGVLINQSIHALDLLLMWMGEPVSVEASMQNHRLKRYIEVEDTLEAYLTFSNEEEPVRATFFATNTYVSDEPVFIELACEHGFVRMEGGRVWYQTGEHQSPVFWQEAAQSLPGKAYWGNGHSACIRDFYQSLSTGEKYRNNLGSTEITFKTVMDIYDSARCR